MSDNKIHTLGRIDQAIRGINSDGTDDGYIPPQSENGALERIEKSIKDIDIKGIKNSYKVLQTGEGHAEDYPMLISPNYQFKPSIRDKVFFEDSITYNPAAQGMKIASHNDGPGEHVKMRAPFASIHEDNPQPAFIELGSDSVKATLKKDDLVLTGEGNTWDGEHGSLKEALAGVSGGPTRTTLFEAPDGGGVWMDSPTKYFDLNDDIDNYDEIEIICLTTEGDNNYYYAGTQKYIVTDLLEPRKDNSSMGMPFRASVVRTTGLDTSSLSVVLIPQGTSTAIAKRTIMCLSAIGGYNWGVAIHKVIGVKY